MSGKIVVIAGPSGSGKNTLINRLVARQPRIGKLVTVTTRLPREGEQEGKDYFFYTPEQFDAALAEGDLVGTRFVPTLGGIRYGILVPELEKAVKKYRMLFAPVDLTGMQWLKEHYRIISFFIMPESLEAFRARVKARSTMPPAEFEQRMKITEAEVHLHAPEYDYRIVNGDGMLAQTEEEIVAILTKEGYTL
jgi:guanylate kinase